MKVLQPKYRITINGQVVIEVTNIQEAVNIFNSVIFNHEYKNKKIDLWSLDESVMFGFDDVDVPDNREWRLISSRDFRESRETRREHSSKAHRKMRI
jgi:hypothetical protein